MGGLEVIFIIVIVIFLKFVIVIVFYLCIIVFVTEEAVWEERGGGDGPIRDELAEASKPDGDRGDHLVLFLEPDL